MGTGELLQMNHSTVQWPVLAEHHRRLHGGCEVTLEHALQWQSPSLLRLQLRAQARSSGGSRCRRWRTSIRGARTPRTGSCGKHSWRRMWCVLVCMSCVCGDGWQRPRLRAQCACACVRMFAFVQFSFVYACARACACVCMSACGVGWGLMQG